jgi:hypothetical protein
MQKHLCLANLCGLQALKALSVRGCGSLITLLLPVSIDSLDASGSSCLKIVAYAAGKGDDRAPLKVLNLTGCRVLQHSLPWAMASNALLLGRPAALTHCHELVLSDCARLSEQHHLCTTLRECRHLVAVALRRVASDVVLIALAESEAARSGALKLADCSFSSDILSDVGVEALVTASQGLEQLNLRGCPGVSAACYNQTPITLLARSQQAKTADGGPGASSISGASTSSSTSSPQKYRKGDNLFRFGLG